jgi:hypothetical protein
LEECPQVELQLLGFKKFQFVFNKSQDTARVSMVEEVSRNVVVAIIVIVVATSSTEAKA